MSRRIADLLIKIGADSYEFQQKAHEVEKGLNSLTKKLDKIGKEMSLKLTAPLATLGFVSLKAFDDSARAVAKVEQAIKSTGSAARLTSTELGKFASELQGKTLFEDDFILNNATAQLLTFTNIAGSNFKRTQAVALDLATVLDGDLKSASIQLGKALNDPVKNLSALSRSGIQFSEEQKNVINNLAKTNRLAEAQTVILAELERQYGGQAEAAAKVGIGALTQLKNSWGDFLEQIGQMMMPVVTKIAGILSKVVEVLQRMNPSLLKTVTFIASITAAIGPLVFAIGGVIKILPMLLAGFTALFSPIGLVLTAISAGAVALIAFGGNADKVSEVNGDLTNKIIDESKQINILITQLSSANTSEQKRKTVMEELKKIQPDIVEGLSAEKLELEALSKKASEYNQKLVLRIALARKQDQIAAASERQTEVGIKYAEKEAELYSQLSEIGSRIYEGKFEMGIHNQKKGFFEWSSPSIGQERDIIEQFNNIMASGDKLNEKARKVWLLFKPSTAYSNKIKMDVNPNELTTLSGDLFKLNKEITKADEAVSKAKDDVQNFVKTFSLSLDDINRNGNEVGVKVDLETEVAKGKLVLLKEQIDEFEKKKQSAFNINDIAHFNTEINRLKIEFNELNAITQDQLNRKSISTVVPNDVKSITPLVDIKFPDLSPIISKYQQQMQMIKDTVNSGIFNWADTTSAGLQSSIMKTEEIVSNYTQSLVSKGWEFGDALDFVSTKVAEITSSLNNLLNQFISESIVSVAEGIGQIAVGDLGFDSLGKTILTLMADFLKLMGTQLVEFGVQMQAFQLAMESIIHNPFIAIGVGVAMIAAATIMKSLINKKAKNNAPKLANGGLAYGPTYAMVGDNRNASVDPEVIAPLSKLKNIMSQGGSQNVSLHLSGQLIAKGRDLVYVLGKENYKLGVIGG